MNLLYHVAVFWRGAFSFTIAATALSANAQFFYGYDAIGTGPRPNHNAAKAAFLVAAGSVGSNDLEMEANGPLNGALSFGAGLSAQAVSSTGASTVNSEITTTSIYSCFAYSGAKYYLALVSPGVTFLTLTFSQPLRAFGFSASDEADWGRSSNPGHQMLLGNGEVYSLTPDVPYDRVDGNAAFYGVVSNTPFTTVSFRYPTNGAGSGANADAIGLDDLMAAPVPEPASFAALGLGLATVLRRRSRR